MATLAQLAELLETRRAGAAPFLIGITGAVAAGKSTLAAQLQSEMARSGVRADILTTDGFLFPNAALEAMGILGRKGFPESYDAAGLRRALAEARRGPIEVPGYSHVIYD
ncbi:MAG: hypothetical protein ACREEW_10585, partial [Caulobacteraceae bacterium]